MKVRSLLVLALLLQFCSSNKKVESDRGEGYTRKKIVLAPITNFLITSSSVGNIEIGQSMDKLRKNYEGYNIMSVPAWNYCLDGGGNGVEISDGDEKLLFVCPTYGNDTVSIIMALSPKFYTKDGMRPSGTVGQLLRRHPGMTINNNAMCPGEFFKDDAKKMMYKFTSSDSNPVGIYKDGEFTTSKFDTTRKIEHIWISKFLN